MAKILLIGMFIITLFMYLVIVGASKNKTAEEIAKEKTTEKQDTYHTLVIDERKTFSIKQVATIIKEGKKTPIYLTV